MGKKLSDETKRKIGESQIGKKLSEEHKKKLSLAKIGNKCHVGFRHTMSDQSKRKISESNKGKIVSEETRDKIRIGLTGNKNNLGRVLSEETKLKIGNKNRGKVRSPELKKHLSEKLKGRILSMETRMKMSKSRTGKKQVTLPSLKKTLQEIFNSYIRLRDKDKPCISCGEFKPNMQAGHFYAVGGYDGLRFDEDNCGGECAYCNCFNESHLITYGLNLENRIGYDRVQNLHIKAQAYKRNGYKWMRFELEQMIKDYKEKIHNLKQL